MNPIVDFLSISHFPTLHIRSRRQQEPEDEEKVKDTFYMMLSIH
ncbi:hypothetical protein [Parapedobacter sp. DT-150]